MTADKAQNDSRNRVMWYVMHAYRQEKLAEKTLSGPDGLEYFIAKHYIIRNCAGKKTRLLVPSIPGIIFVHASRSQLLAFKSRHDFLHFRMWRKSTGTEFLTVPEREMDSFIRVAGCEAAEVRYYRPGEISLKAGTRVRIHGGALDGVEGTFVRVRGRRSRQVVVVIPEVRAVTVEVRPDLLEPLDVTPGPDCRETT